MNADEEAAEIRLFYRLRAFKEEGRTEDALALRNKLAEDHMGLVRYVARRLHLRAPESQPLDDFVGYGNIGLLDAVDKFDPDLGVKFATYAVQRIRGSIFDGLRTEDSLSRGARRRVKDLDAVEAYLFEVYNREPTQTEIAETMKISAREMGRIKMDALSTRRDIDSYRDLEPTSQYDDPELSAMLAALHDESRRRLSTLEEVDLDRVYHYYTNTHGAGDAEHATRILDKLLRWS